MGDVTQNPIVAEGHEQERYPAQESMRNLSPDASVAAHFDAISPAYYDIVDANKHGLLYYHRRELETVLHWIPSNDAVLVLDAGCGPGRITAALERRGLSTVSVDISRRMLQSMTAKRKAEGNGRTGTSVLGDVRRLPFKTSRFDWIICLEVLEHLPSALDDAEQTIYEFARLLKPDGHLVVEFPLRLHGLFRSMLGMREPSPVANEDQLRTLRYHNRFRVSEMRRIWRRAGMQCVSREFVRVLPAGMVTKLEPLGVADRILERIPVIQLAARETVLLLRKPTRIR